MSHLCIRTLINFDSAFIYALMQTLHMYVWQWNVHCAVT